MFNLLKYSGAILIATNYGLKIASDAKIFRLYWVFGVSLALCIECSSLIFPQFFLILASSANFLKLTSLSCSNISRTIILNDFARYGNISDITNKYMIHQNISTFIGNVFGFIVSLCLPQTFIHTFGFIFCLSALNIYISYRGLKYIELNEFNFQRAMIFSQEYITNKLKILSPSEVCLKEKVFLQKMKNIKFCKVSPEIILNSDKTGYIIRLIDIFKDRKFFIYVKKKGLLRFFGLNRFEIYSFLKINADNNDIFMAFLLSIKINLLLKEKKRLLFYKDISSIIEEANLWLNEINEEELFSEIKKSGWNSNFNSLEENFSRYQILIKPR